MKRVVVFQLILKLTGERTLPKIADYSCLCVHAICDETYSVLHPLKHAGGVRDSMRRFYVSSETEVYSKCEVKLKKINENTVFIVMDYFTQAL